MATDVAEDAKDPSSRQERNILPIAPIPEQSPNHPTRAQRRFRQEKSPNHQITQYSTYQQALQS